MAHIGYFSIILLSLATANAISRCNDDKDCPERQYCYDVSHHCANYTICSRYNRLEGKESARHPSNCGPCIQGYHAEILSTKEPADLCSKILVAQEEDEPPSTVPIHIWVPALVILIVVIVGMIVIKSPAGKWLNDHMRPDNNCRTWTNMCNFGPSAPPLESGAYVEVGDPQHYMAVVNNNHNYTDKNKLVAATPFHSPDWVKTNPNYNVQEPHEVLEQPSTPEPIPPEEDTNPSSWTPEQVAEAVPVRPFSQFNSEQRDNTMNAVLVQRNCPAVSSISDSNDSTSETNDSQSNSDHIRGPNILISQKITMNVNVLNGDF